MDWMEEEQQRGITITSAATTPYWPRSPRHYQSIRRPCGLHDRGRALAARFGRRGSPCSRQGRREASRKRSGVRRRYGVPRIAYVTDGHPWSGFSSGRGHVTRQTGRKPAPRAAPHRKAEEDFRGIIDLCRNQAILYKASWGRARGDGYPRAICGKKQQSTHGDRGGDRRDSRGSFGRVFEQGDLRRCSHPRIRRPPARARCPGACAEAHTAQGRSDGCWTQS